MAVANGWTTATIIKLDYFISSCLLGRLWVVIRMCLGDVFPSSIQMNDSVGHGGTVELQVLYLNVDDALPVSS